MAGKPRLEAAPPQHKFETELTPTYSEVTREIEGATKAGPGRGESAEAITAATPETEGSAPATEEAATAMTPKESTPAKRTTTATTAATARESPIRSNFCLPGPATQCAHHHQPTVLAPEPPPKLSPLAAAAIQKSRAQSALREQKHHR